MDRVGGDTYRLTPCQRLPVINQQVINNAPAQGGFLMVRVTNQFPLLPEYYNRDAHQLLERKVDSGSQRQTSRWMSKNQWCGFVRWVGPRCSQSIHVVGNRAKVGDRDCDFHPVTLPHELLCLVVESASKLVKFTEGKREEGLTVLRSSELSFMTV